LFKGAKPKYTINHIEKDGVGVIFYLNVTGADIFIVDLPLKTNKYPKTKNIGVFIFSFTFLLMFFVFSYHQKFYHICQDLFLFLTQVFFKNYFEHQYLYERECCHGNAGFT